MVSSSGTAVDDDVGGSTVKHVRTYQVYRGMSPEAVSRLEVCSQQTTLTAQCLTLQPYITPVCHSLELARFRQWQQRGCGHGSLPLTPAEEPR